MELKKRLYETTVIINPSMEDHQIEETVKTIEDIITKNGGTIKSVEKWGRRRLAYPINKRNNGYYVLVEFEGDGNFIPSLEQRYQHDENIMRYLTVKLNEKAIKARELQKLKPKTIDEDLDLEIDLIEDVDLDDDEELESNEPKTKL